MLRQIIILCAITFLPLIELRLAIPVGILTGTMNLPFGLKIMGMGMNPILVFFLTIVMGFILGVLIFNLLTIFDGYLQNSKFSKKYMRLLHHAQKKLHPYIKKYGILGLALYIAFPIPGTGVYMGTLGGYVLGMKKKHFYLSLMIGVILAAAIVTILTILGKVIL